MNLEKIYTTNKLKIEELNKYFLKIQKKTKEQKFI